MGTVPLRFRHRLVILSLLVCAAAGASLSLWSRAGSLRTEDRNGDGRPDLWRTYDRQGRLSEVAIDTNFDGRSDVHEYYEDGALARRESDRNFDDRVDLVQQFDYTTHEQVRVVEDIDYDGTADLLVLFQGGRPVFSKWAHGVAAAVAIGTSAPHPQVAPRRADDPLTPLDDPFRTDLVVRPVHAVGSSRDGVGLWTSGGLPASRLNVVHRLGLTSAIDPAGCRYSPSALFGLHSPRGPPVSHS